MKSSIKSRPNLNITALSLLLGAIGLNIGYSPEAGDSLPANVSLVLGLGLFVLAIWLWTKRYNGLKSKDFTELAVALAMILVALGLVFTSIGTGAGNMVQNDGYNVSGGLMALAGGLVIGVFFGARYGLSHSTVKKGKGGKK